MTIIYRFERDKFLFKILRKNNKYNQFSKKQLDHISFTLREFESKILKFSIPFIITLYIILLSISSIFVILIYNSTEKGTLNSIFFLATFTIAYIIFAMFYFLMIRFSNINVKRARKHSKKKLKQLKAEFKILGLEINFKDRIPSVFNLDEAENNYDCEESTIRKYFKTKTFQEPERKENLKTKGKKKKLILEDNIVTERTRRSNNFYILFKEKLDEGLPSLEEEIRVMNKKRGVNSAPRPSSQRIVTVKNKNFSEHLPKKNTVNLTALQLKMEHITRIRKEIKTVRDINHHAAKNYLKKKYTVFENIEKISGKSTVLVREYERPMDFEQEYNQLNFLNKDSENEK